MRVLVVSNMAPSAAAPERGSFVRDQVAALRRIGSLDVETLDFAPGTRRYPAMVAALRRRLRRDRFDLVHAHYGLTGWVARLAGARPLVVTFHGTDVRHPVVGRLSRRLAGLVELAAVASDSLFEPRGGRPGLPRPPGHSATLPCGVDLERFAPADRGAARERLGLEAGGRYLLLPADPARPVKRADRAREVARLAGATLLTAGGLPREQMADHVNASAAVLVCSDDEGFGLAALEALACDVPVLSTPVGIAPTALREIDGCLVGDFDAERWAALARDHLDAEDPRVAGRERAARWSTDACAERVADAYRAVLAGPSSTGHQRERWDR